MTKGEAMDLLVEALTAQRQLYQLDFIVTDFLKDMERHQAGAYSDQDLLNILKALAITARRVQHDVQRLRTEAQHDTRQLELPGNHHKE